MISTLISFSTVFLPYYFLIYCSPVPGNRLVSSSVSGWNLGLTICYDVRFSELYKALRGVHRIQQDTPRHVNHSISAPVDAKMKHDKQSTDSCSGVIRPGAEVMLVPAAFTPKTGEPHWETLLRARAIETQSYVIAAAQAGAHNAKRTSYGHSMIIDPWGTVGKNFLGNRSA